MLEGVVAEQASDLTWQLRRHLKTAYPALAAWLRRVRAIGRACLQRRLQPPLPNGFLLALETAGADPIMEIHDAVVVTREPDPATVASLLEETVARAIRRYGRGWSIPPDTVFGKVSHRPWDNGPGKWSPGGATTPPDPGGTMETP